MNRKVSRTVVCVLGLASVAVLSVAAIRVEGLQAVTGGGLVGGWHVVAIQRDGNSVTVAEAIKGMHLSFERGSVVIAGLYGKSEERCPFTVNDAVLPKHLDWTRPNGTRVELLYEMTEKALRIAFPFAGSTDRPKVISGAAGSKTIVLVLERD